MKIGYVGLGKLGSVCSAVLAKHGHDVIGYDPFALASIPEYESNTEGLLAVGQYDSIDRLVAHADLIFIAVQTPHSPEYGGELPFPEKRRDFEYGYLVQACRDVFTAVNKEYEGSKEAKLKTVVIVSTVLPGTVQNLIRPMKPSNVNLVYSPHFIAMGTTVKDYENPEFFLIGEENPGDSQWLQEAYRQVNAEAPHFVTTVANAELIKVAYNTFISMKIVWANTMMEISHKLGTDSDIVVDALTKAGDRIMSPKYLRGGVGDAGACHPRDLIAMSHLAEKLELSVDFMGFLAQARDRQSEWLVDLAHQWSRQSGLPVVLLGKAYKPNISLSSGSIGLLMKSQFLKRGLPEPRIVDPHTDNDRLNYESYDIDAYPKVFVLVTAHDAFLNLKFPKGSIVIDPHAAIGSQEGVTLIRVGRKS